MFQDHIEVRNNLICTNKFTDIKGNISLPMSRII